MNLYQHIRVFKIKHELLNALGTQLYFLFLQKRKLLPEQNGLSTRFFTRGHLSLDTFLTLSSCLPRPLPPQVKTDFAKYRGRSMRNYFPQTHSRRRSRIIYNFVAFICIIILLSRSIDTKNYTIVQY